MHYRKLWIVLGVVVAAAFSVLGYFGLEIYRQAPPIPQRVVTTDNVVIFTREDIHNGQNVWQSLGGQNVWFVLEIKTGWSLGEELPSVGGSVYIRSFQTGQ